MKKKNDGEFIECDIVITLMKYIILGDIDTILYGISSQNKKDLNEIEYHRLRQYLRYIITRLPNEYFIIPKEALESKEKMMIYIKKFSQSKEYEELRNKILKELKIQKQIDLNKFLER